MEKTWKDAYWDLFHILAQIMLCLTTDSERSEKRRHYDGFLKHKQEQIDQIMSTLPKD